MSYPAVKTDLIDVSDKLKQKYRVFFKLENQQPSGSFKLRGLGHLIGTNIVEAKRKGGNVEVFSSSGGNAGMAAAYSSQFYGVNCTVVLPKTSKPLVSKTLQDYGATVYVHGNNWAEADSYLREKIIGELPSSTVPIYCHPFDDPVVWEGHSAMISEIEQQFSVSDLEKVKGFVCSVGGGGLLCGIIEGLKNSKYLNKVPVLAVESTGAASFDAAIKKGEIVTLDKVDSYATTLAAPFVCQKALDNYKSYPLTNRVIPELQMLQGTVFYYDNFHEVVEPACGASVSMVCNNDEFQNLGPEDIVIVIVCGGTATTESDIDLYRSLLK